MDPASEVEAECHHREDKVYGWRGLRLAAKEDYEAFIRVRRQVARTDSLVGSLERMCMYVYVDVCLYVCVCVCVIRVFMFMYGHIPGCMSVFKY